MRKIVKQISVFSIVFLGITGVLYGKDIKFNIQAPKFVKQGQRFKIAFNLNEKPQKDIVLPNIKKVRTLFGPSVSSSTSIQMINGSFSSTKSYVYSYVLLAEELGKTTIPAISATIDGKIYKTSSTTIEILKNEDQIPVQNNQVQPSQKQRTSTSHRNLKKFFVRVHLSKNNAYPNEHIVATLKLYTLYNGISDANITPPSFKGFISKEIPNSGQNQFVQENVNGAIYNTIVVSKYVLFPQHSGNLIIDDFSISALAQERVGSAQDIFDNFFGNNVRQFRIEAKNPKVTVKVSPLPINKPTDYKGGVGNFSISSSLTPDSVKVNEAITLKVNIKGNGNLQMLKAPKLKLSPDMEIYDPKANNNTKVNTGGVNGSITYEYLIIPRHAGIYKIPAVTFSYFSPKERKYKTLKTASYTIKVNKGNAPEGTANSQAITRYQNTQHDVTNLGNDIKYIKTKNTGMQEKGFYMLNNFLFWIIILGMPILFVFYLILKKQHLGQNSDKLSNKSKKANKIATKRLRIAKKSLQNNEKEAFYNHTLDALWGFISHKLHLPISQLNKDNITQHLLEKNIDNTIITDYLDILNKCEMAQYSPVDSVDMSSDYKKAIAIISKLEQNL